MATAVTMLLLHQDVPAVLVALLAPIAISAADDVRPQPAWIRLVVHVLAGLIAVRILEIAPVWAVPAVFTMVWMANLFNFMDGSDGFAIASAACYLIGFAAALPPGPWFPVICAVAGSLLGILFFNLPPAKLFLGDAGSVPLGLLLAICGISGHLSGHWAWWFPLAVVFPFFLDATWTLVARLLRGETPWHAHREHLYQRLAARGLSALALMLGASAINALNVLVVLLAHKEGGTIGAAIAAANMAALAAVYFAVRRWVAQPADSVDN